MHHNHQYFSIYIWSKFKIFEERGTLLPYRPCAVAESEVNAQESWTQEVLEEELLTTMTRLRLESLVRL
jgi:hypothetical protein